MHVSRKKRSPSATRTNNQLPTPTPPIKYMKEELATFQPQAGGEGQMSVSSGGIAASNTYSSRNPVGTPPNKPGSDVESSWKTAYEAARMAVEVDEEPSNMFLPLKAVAGALSVLIKSYGVSSPRSTVSSIADCFPKQTTVNADQIKDIEERVRSLGEVLASPVGERDVEERARREALKRYAP